MPLSQDNNIVACVSQEKEFSDRIGHAAVSLGSEFIRSSSFAEDLIKNRGQGNSCLVVDFDSISRDQAIPCRRLAKDHLLLMAVTPGDVAGAFQAASAGAAGVFEKRATEPELEFLIEAAFASDATIRQQLSGANRFSSEAFTELTPREKSVLNYLMEGEPNKRVAAILDIGLRTVEGDRAQVMRKLCVASFAELVQRVTQLERDIINSRQAIFTSIALGKSNPPLTGC